MKKGQIALEYLMIVGILIGILVPFWLYISLYSSDIEFGFRTEYAKTAVTRITDAANFVYTQGSPAKLSLEIYFPKDIDSTTVIDKTVTIIVSGEDIYAKSIASLAGELPTSPGYHSITITSMGDYVEIT